MDQKFQVMSVPCARFPPKRRKCAGYEAEVDNMEDGGEEKY